MFKDNVAIVGTTNLCSVIKTVGANSVVANAFVEGIKVSPEPPVTVGANVLNNRLAVAGVTSWFAVVVTVGANKLSAKSVLLGMTVL